LKACICAKFIHVEPPVLATLMADTGAHVGGGGGDGDGAGDGVVVDAQSLAMTAATCD